MIIRTGADELVQRVWTKRLSDGNRYCFQYEGVEGFKKVVVDIQRMYEEDDRRKKRLVRKVVASDNRVDALRYKEDA